MVTKNNYHPKKYLELVERLQDPILDKYMKQEFDFIIQKLKSKPYHVYELGAGYGRVIPRIIKHSLSFTGIEIDENMFNELTINHKHIENTTAIKGDITKLSEHVSINAESNNLFLLCQNTLGVIEGDYNDLINELNNLKSIGSVEVVLSIFNGDALPTHGLSLYKKLTPMVGKFDQLKSQLDKGLFVSETGYESKWWSESEINEIIETLRASVLAKHTTEVFSLIHLKLS